MEKPRPAPAASAPMSPPQALSPIGCAAPEEHCAERANAQATGSPPSLRCWNRSYPLLATTAPTGTKDGMLGSRNRVGRHASLDHAKGVTSHDDRQRGPTQLTSALRAKQYAGSSDGPLR